MTQDEILEDLESKGIILKLNDEFYITERYKELIALEGQLKKPEPEKEPKKSTLDFEKLICKDEVSVGNSWPPDIMNTKGRTRAVALMNFCDIPATPRNKTYRLRGLTDDAVRIITNIVNSEDIHPGTFVEAIKIYYKYTEMPQSFKNLLVEGLVMDLYREHTSGDLELALKKASGNINPENPNQWG